MNRQLFVVLLFVICRSEVEAQPDLTPPPQGHTRLILQASHPEVTEISPYCMRQTEEVLRKRLTQGPLPGLLSPRPMIRIVNGQQFEILLHTTNPQEIARTVQRLQRFGGLELAILADSDRHREIIAKARQMSERQTRLMQSDNLQAQWVETVHDRQGKPVEIAGNDNLVTRVVAVTEGQKTIERTQYLVVYEDSEDHIVDGYLWKAAVLRLPEETGYAIGYDWGSSGGSRVERMTRRYQPEEDGTVYRLGVLLDGKLHSAPELHSVIGAKGQINGDFTAEEVYEHVKVLNSGSHWLHLQVLSTMSNEETN